MDPDDAQPRPASRRTFSEPARGRGPRDVDAAHRVLVTRALVSGVYGGILGLALAFFLVQNGTSLWIALLCPVVAWAAVSGGILLLTTSAGRAASSLYAPASGSTPRPKEYSQAESLVARGLYPEAITTFELVVAEDPSDPTPYLRVARINRDHLGSYEDAVRWFRRALRESTIPPGQALLARKELIEVFVHRMGSPERALPELARLAEELAGTPDGDRAAAELKDIKSRM